jgi:hypothetical protein
MLIEVAKNISLLGDLLKSNMDISSDFKVSLKNVANILFPLDNVNLDIFNLKTSETQHSS